MLLDGAVLGEHVGVLFAAPSFLESRGRQWADRGQPGSGQPLPGVHRCEFHAGRAPMKSWAKPPPGAAPTREEL
jgi:hypothetical protein